MLIAFCEASNDFEPTQLAYHRSVSTGSDYMKNILKYCALGLALAAGSASASIVTYYGADDGAVSGANSSAALNSYLAATGSNSLIDFQGLVNNLVNFANVTIGTGLSPTVTGNSDGGIVSQGAHAQLMGFNAFGAFLTDTQSGVPGGITVSFNDGTSQSLGITKNASNGGLLFFGFTDTDKSFSSVTINTGATSSTRDIFGIDDVHFAAAPAATIAAAVVLEPASLTLLGL